MIITLWLVARTDGWIYNIIMTARSEWLIEMEQCSCWCWNHIVNDFEYHNKYKEHFRCSRSVSFLLLVRWIHEMWRSKAWLLAVLLVPTTSFSLFNPFHLSKPMGSEEKKMKFWIESDFFNQRDYKYIN